MSERIQVSKTQAARSKAKRIREKIRKGERVSQTAREWLAEYDKSRLAKKDPPSEPKAPSGIQSPPAVTTIANQEMVDIPRFDGTPDPESRERWQIQDGPKPPEHREVVSQLPEYSAVRLVDDGGTGQTCGKKDCPECTVKRGGYKCSVTGKTVFPPMSAAGSEALAATLCAIIGTVIRFFRPDRRIIQPNKEEIKALGAALREVSFRRASWMGAWDDLFALASGVGRFAWRALGEPQTKPQDGAQPPPQTQAAA